MGKVTIEGDNLLAFYGAEAGPSNHDLHCSSYMCGEDGLFTDPEIKDAVLMAERKLNESRTSTPATTERRLTLVLDENYRERESTWELAGTYMAKGKIEVTARWSGGHWKLFGDPKAFIPLGSEQILPSSGETLEALKSTAFAAGNAIARLAESASTTFVSAVSSLANSLSHFFSSSESEKTANQP